MKKIVDFKTLNGDTMKMEQFGRVILEDGDVSYEGLTPHFIKEMNDFGVIGSAKVGPLFPRDGLVFLEALQREFSGSMLRASAVREENLTGK